jgi:hypothetical protein
MKKENYKFEIGQDVMGSCDFLYIGTIQARFKEESYSVCYTGIVEENKYVIGHKIYSECEIIEHDSQISRLADRIAKLESRPKRWFS